MNEVNPIEYIAEDIEKIMRKCLEEGYSEEYCRNELYEYLEDDIDIYLETEFGDDP